MVDNVDYPALMLDNAGPSKLTWWSKGFFHDLVIRVRFPSS
jgi:hypothetical protein